ncbi:uncharacterized protein LOC123539113 [Mercenaria mercenaria]|uniref:uncharacterized protein LOC123539113 n=1 Tax=Mercenaria mercenaria TaxID=6596 RepID=UPI00234EA1DA|nr:uncharacterized protein LOC123539113 [Mercenaria mercenaria]
MDRKEINSVRIYRIVLWCCIFGIFECIEIKVKKGNSAEFELPGIKSCGQYSLLSPALRPVVVVEGNNSTNIIAPYDKRASIAETRDGFKLTLKHLAETDAGKYKVTSSSVNLAPPCVIESFYVTVLEPHDVHMEPWEEWSFCISQCSPHRHRSRSRKCSVKGACDDMGPTFQTETCDNAAHCPKWSSWGGWGACSAKCGKGFKIRKRACLSGKSSLVRSSECRGISTQSHMCLTVCEVVGTWTQWSAWSNCTASCGNDVIARGTRTRERSCSTDSRQRFVTQNCIGDRTEDETCSSECTTPTPSENSTEAVHILGVADDNSGTTFSIIPVVAGSACALIVIVILIILIVLKTRVQRRRDSVPTLRPSDAASNRRKKVSKERRSGTPCNAVETGTGNVYSELNSSFCYSSSEFDSVYSVDNPGFPKSSAINVMETIKDDEGEEEVSDGYDSEFDDNPEVTGRSTICERKEIIYEKSRASCQRTNSEEDKVNYGDNKSMESEDFVVTENECYEPPELWSNDDVIHSFGTNTCHDDVTHANEIESIYYEPPVENEEDDASKRAEMKRQESEMTEESVYENCEASRGTIKTSKQMHAVENNDDYYEIPENTKSISTKESNTNITEETEMDIPKFTQVNMRNGSIVTIDERYPHLSKEDLDSEHTYVNEKIPDDEKHFYVTPKYSYGIGMQENKRDSKEHIYDIPKFGK